MRLHSSSYSLTYCSCLIVGSAIFHTSYLNLNVNMETCLPICVPSFPLELSLSVSSYDPSAARLCKVTRLSSCWLNFHKAAGCSNLLEKVASNYNLLVYFLFTVSARKQFCSIMILC